MPKLEIKTVSKHYGKKKALDGFTFTFTKGIYGCSDLTEQARQLL